nr:DMT family transporter [Leucobacter weissii]
MVLIGAVLASLPELRPGSASLLLVVPLLVGAGSALQSALNGRIAVAGSSIAAASFFNFLTGTLLLAVAAGASVLIRGVPAQWPESPLLYSAGVIGVVVIAGIALLVRFGGVLLVGMSNVAGQLIGSVLVDALVPLGAGPSAPLLAGTAVTLVAVIVAALPRRRGSGPDRPRRRPRRT